MRPRHAFTLIELVVVIVVLGTIAAVATPKYFDYADRARRSAAKAARAALVEAVEQQRLANAVNGSSSVWPPTIDAVLQGTGGERVLNPYVGSGQAVFDTDGASDPTKFHPNNKTIESASSAGTGAIWYNSLTGSVRFRIPQQANDPATVAMYNDVNSCAVVNLTQTSP